MTRRLADSGLRRRLMLVLALALAGHGTEWMLRPVVSLLVLDGGGTASLVGIVTAAYAVPAILFRPLIGSAVDLGHGVRFARLGSMTMSLAALALVLPGTLLMIAVRFVHGLAWSFLSVANQVSLAALAPAHRRAEIAGYFAAVPALAALIGPALGVAIYVGIGAAGTLLAASCLALVAFAITVVSSASVFSAPSVAAREAAPLSAPAVTVREKWLGRLFEPSAIAPMLMSACFMGAQALFIVFPPVYAHSLGLPTADLSLYYVAHGIIFVGCQAMAGRLADRMGRFRAVVIGSLFAIAGLAVPIPLSGLLVLVIAAAVFSIGFSLVNATTMAMTIDRAPAGRMGSSMATFSVGYQLGGAGSGILWGAVIDLLGYPWPFAIAVGLVLVAVGILLRMVRPPPSAGRKVDRMSAPRPYFGKAGTAM